MADREVDSAAVKIDGIDARCMLHRMLSRVRNHFRGAKFARMSSGTYCVIRDLGLVKGGKGMRHHEVLVTFSPEGRVAVDGRRREKRGRDQEALRLA